MRRLLIGDATVHYRVACVERTVFVKGHYLQPGLLQDDLDGFWLRRHRAAQILFESLDDVEDALRGCRPVRSD